MIEMAQASIARAIYCRHQDNREFIQELDLAKLNRSGESGVSVSLRFCVPGCEELIKFPSALGVILRLFKKFLCVIGVASGQCLEAIL